MSLTNRFQTDVDLSSSIETPRRFLSRVWKCYKPHLPKSTSLPTLKLIPFHRPLFTCLSCGFTNTLIPLCLWCAWTSLEATRTWEASMPRIRRISAPAKVFQQDNYQNERRQPRTSLESMASTLPPITPRAAAIDVIPGIMAIVESTFASKATDRTPPPLCGRSSLQDEGEDFSDDGRLIKTRPLPLFLHPNSGISDHYDRLSEAEPKLDTFPPSLSSSSIVDVPSLSTEHLHFPPFKLSTPQPLSSAPHTLRRKKRMTILRQKSSCSLRPKFLSPGDHNHRPVTPPSIRIGTPNRPYYTAIRKNISRPNSFSPMHSRSPSPSPPQTPTSAVMPQLMSIFSTPSSTSDEYPPLPLIPHLQLSHFGHSVSGETELRMSLPDYRFREMARVSAKGRCVRSVRRKVRKLRRGIMDMMTKNT